MLAVALVVVALLWAFWLTYMVRYPRAWSEQVDRIHARLKPYGLSYPWMARVEKGRLLKTIVAATTVLTLLCLVLVLSHPQALGAFFTHHLSK